MSHNKVSPSGGKGNSGGWCPWSGGSGPPPPTDVNLRYLADGASANDTLHKHAAEAYGCGDDHCTGSMLNPKLGEIEGREIGEPRPKNVLLEQATDFLVQFYESLSQVNSPKHKNRLKEVTNAIRSTGTYELTPDELNFGVKTAWRNASRCIGRIVWSKLKLMDARYCKTASDMFEAVCNHISYGTNGGKIRSTITIFPARTDGRHDYRVWNTQFITYAGYQQEDGSIIGDPANVKFTEIVTRMGWKGEGTPFDVLPMLLQANGAAPEWFDIPKDLVLEVTLKHPKYSWFQELGYKWYCLPAVANMMLDCGGLEFTGAPFNGWYMGTEIGARDLCDSYRYNITKIVAEKMQLDVTNNMSLWKDAAMLEVNIAVLHSFQAAGVTISDHHSASESFMKHLETENRVRGGCPADWVWVVPPISGSLCPVFHQEMLNYKLKPSYEYQEAPWENQIFAVAEKQNKDTKNDNVAAMARHLQMPVKVVKKASENKQKCLIIYATETGKSETFAKSLATTLAFGFQVQVKVMSDCKVANLEKERFVFVVASTFGNGDPPDNGVEFAQSLNATRNGGSKAPQQMGSNVSLSFVTDANDTDHVGDKILKNTRFAVFALGSKAYPKFCAFGKYVDRLLEELGGERANSLGEGDELQNQEEDFHNWAKATFKIVMKQVCDELLKNNPCLGKGDEEVSGSQQSVGSTIDVDETWNPQHNKLVPALKQPPISHIEALTMMHNQVIKRFEYISHTQLQNPKSDGETILVRLSTKSAGNVEYEAGDHIAIYPSNRTETVEPIIARLSGSENPDTPVQLGTKEYGRWATNNRLCPTSIREALTRYLDVTTPPSPSFLALLANITPDGEEREKLKSLAKSSAAYEDWRYSYQPTIAEVLRQFQSVAVSPTLLLSQLPRLQPRWYSVSSSPAVHTGEIHLTVGVINYETPDGKVRNHGVCTTWLRDLEGGCEVPALVRAAPRFRLPEDKRLPIIMVGPGTGIAPYRSFWHQRQAEKKKAGKGEFGKMVLYFGCRRSDYDNLYKEERDRMEAEGVITAQRTAVSREPGKNKYVQHLMQSFSEEVFTLLTTDCGHLYICGNVDMASEVSNTLKEIIKSEGRLSNEEAAAYLAQMRRENRIHEDIFGVSCKKTRLQRLSAKK